MVTVTDLTAPVDPLHDECVVARRAVNAWYLDARMRAAVWTPRPMPDVYRKGC